MTKVECYCYHKLGHVAQDCLELNKVTPCDEHPHFLYVSSTVLMADANSL